MRATALVAGLAAAAIPSAPSAAQCRQVRAHRELPAIQAYDPRPRAPRFFAMQFRQDAAYVTTYAAYRTKIECMIRDYVVPHLARGRPNVVVFNEAVGLATLATGSRGAGAREAFAHRGSAGCENQGQPCGALGALTAIMAAYAPQVAAYKSRFPSLGPLTGTWVAATDTLVRAFMQTFSDMAHRYRIYIAGSNFQAQFRESTDPNDIALFHDPDYPTPGFVYVATSPEVYNEVFMWGPHDVRHDGPLPLRNVVASNLKVPLTQLEQEIGFAPGPSTGPAAVANVAPYALPGTAARLGFATSLPAFTYGSPAPGTDPCSDTSLYYMRCLNKLGTNFVVQDEANDGRWADMNGAGIWQPLDWMGSAWRAVSDPSVRFAYAVNPMMVGNLADLPFDGQSAITQRGLSGRGCHYVGDRRALKGDPASEVAWAGNKPQFLAIAPWVRPDGSRAGLKATAAELAPGSGSPLEDDYVETAIIADLPIPVDGRRPGCVTGGRGGRPAGSRQRASAHGARHP